MLICISGLHDLRLTRLLYMIYFSLDTVSPSVYLGPTTVSDMTPVSDRVHFTIKILATRASELYVLET